MRRTRSIALALACVLSLTGGAYAGAGVMRSQRVDARVRCAHPSEDTLAHVHIVTLTHTGDVYRVRYACDRTGY